MRKRLRTLQGWALVVLYAAMIMKSLSGFIPALGFPSGVVLLIFFLMELALLPPLGMALMSLFVSALFFVLPNLLPFLIGLAAGSVLLLTVGVVLSMLLSGVLVTVVGGVVVSVELISAAAPLAIAMTAAGATAAAGAAVGAGTVASAGAAVMSGGGSGSKGKAVIKAIGSFLVFIALGWPALSYTQAFPGVLACKPASIVGQAHLNYLNYNAYENHKWLFEDRSRWVFGSGFYEDVINNGTNNITQGGKNMAAESSGYMAALVDGVLYVNAENMKRLVVAKAYLPRKTDALVLFNDRAFIFGHDKVFVADHYGSWTWKDTHWTSEFEDLDIEEQFDRVYDILERQNTQEWMDFSYEEVGVVAYAQRNGLLLNYDGATHSAWFASKGKDGAVTVYLQTGQGARQEQVTFTPECKGEGLPYVMIGTQGILYIKADKVYFLSRGSGWAEYLHFTAPVLTGEKPCSVLSINYVDLGDEGEYITYLDDRNRIFVDTSLMGKVNIQLLDFDSSSNKVTAAAGGYIYSIRHEDTLLSTLTFINDVNREQEEMGTAGWGWTEINLEKWSYTRLALQKDVFLPDEPDIPDEPDDPDDPDATDGTEDLYKLYPAPKLEPRRSGSAAYDRKYITASVYGKYAGPDERFYFSYPQGVYDTVDYTIEDGGDHIEIVFTGQGGSGLTVTAQPLPEGTEDLRAFAEALSQYRADRLYNGRVTKLTQYRSGTCRFRIEGWTDSGAGVKCFISGHVDAEHIFLMILTFPVGTDDEDAEVKSYFAKKMDYLCGFGITTDAPKLN